MESICLAWILNSIKSDNIDRCYQLDDRLDNYDDLQTYMAPPSALKQGGPELHKVTLFFHN